LSTAVVVLDVDAGYLAPPRIAFVRLEADGQGERDPDVEEPPVAE
jgi:hypothetical protein